MSRKKQTGKGKKTEKAPEPAVVENQEALEIEATPVEEVKAAEIEAAQNPEPAIDTEVVGPAADAPEPVVDVAPEKKAAPKKAKKAKAKKEPPPPDTRTVVAMETKPTEVSAIIPTRVTKSGVGTIERVIENIVWLDKPEIHNVLAMGGKAGAVHLNREVGIEGREAIAIGRISYKSSADRLHILSPNAGTGMEVDDSGYTWFAVAHKGEIRKFAPEMLPEVEAAEAAAKALVDAVKDTVIEPEAVAETPENAPVAPAAAE